MRSKLSNSTFFSTGALSSLLLCECITTCLKPVKKDFFFKQQFLHIRQQTEFEFNISFPNILSIHSHCADVLKAGLATAILWLLL